MFDNIGRKIMGLASVIFWIGAICSGIGGLILFISILSGGGAGRFFLGLFIGAIVAGLGILFSWLSTLMLYGQGRLIDNSEAIRQSLDDVRQDQNVNADNTYNALTDLINTVNSK